VGFLFNLEVEVTGSKGTAQVTAKGLNQPQAPQNLSYTAPSADGDVEVRNQRGQVMQAPTDAARQAAPQVSAAFGGPAAAAGAAPTRRAPQGQPQAGQGQGGAQASGAFGQKPAAAKPAGPPPVNRAQRRAQEKKKGR
jgi:preprotein translocase subunit SecA